MHLEKIRWVDKVCGIVSKVCGIVSTVHEANVDALRRARARPSYENCGKLAASEVVEL
jgi:hypothetical protein